MKSATLIANRLKFSRFLSCLPNTRCCIIQSYLDKKKLRKWRNLRDGETWWCKRVIRNLIGVGPIYMTHELSGLFSFQPNHHKTKKAHWPCLRSGLNATNVFVYFVAIYQCDTRIWNNWEREAQARIWENLNADIHTEIISMSGWRRMEEHSTVVVFTLCIGGHGFIHWRRQTLTSWQTPAMKIICHC